MSLQRSRPEWSFAKRIEGNTASGAWSEDRAPYGFLLAANVAQKFLRSFSRILGSEALVQNKHRNGRINLLQRLACGFAMYGLHARGYHHQFCLRSLQQDQGVVNGSSGQGVVSGAAQHFPQKRADVCRVVNAKYSWPCVSGFCSRISRAQIGGRDRFFNRVVGFKLREQAGHLERFADLGWHSAEFEVSSLRPPGLHQPYQCSQSAAVDELYLVELQYDVAVFDERISNVRVQRKNFLPGNDPSLALNDQNIAGKE